MTPLTQNPSVLVLVDDNNKVLEIATNVAEDLHVEVVRSEDYFAAKAQGEPFRIKPTNN